MIMGNPMVLMMLFMLGVMIYYPTMLKGLDEEQLKELQVIIRHSEK
jgi:sugar phosphate permease